MLVASIPGVTRTVLFVRGATQSMFAPKIIDLWRAIGRSNGEATERCLQGFEQVLAKAATGLDRQLRIVGQVRHSFDRGNFAEQKIPHEERLRQPNSRKFLGSAHGHLCFQGQYSLHAGDACTALAGDTIFNPPAGTLRRTGMLQKIVSPFERCLELISFYS
jgi:hypothetical protein